MRKHTSAPRKSKRGQHPDSRDGSLLACFETQRSNGSLSSSHAGATPLWRHAEACRLSAQRLLALLQSPPSDLRHGQRSRKELRQDLAGTLASLLWAYLNELPAQNCPRCGSRPSTRQRGQKCSLCGGTGYLSADQLGRLELGEQVIQIPLARGRTK